jgi:hypothetical protein
LLLLLLHSSALLQHSAVGAAAASNNAAAAAATAVLAVLTCRGGFQCYNTLRQVLVALRGGEWRARYPIAQQVRS